MTKLLFKNWTLVSTLLIIISASWIWFSSIFFTSDTIVNSSIPHPGFKAPDFTLSSFSGETITLSDLSGNPVILNLWASWCSPCRAEMPLLQKMQEEYASKGLWILAVNSTIQDDPESAQTFAENIGLSFPVLLDIKGNVSRDYRLQALPTTFFIGPDGIIRDVVVGGPISEALLKTRIEDLFE